MNTTSQTLMAAIVVIAVGAAHAEPITPITLVDRNAELEFDVDGEFSNVDLRIDGVDVLKKQWFWYRIGTTGPEAPIDSLGGMVATTADKDLDAGDEVLDLTFENNQLRVQVKYTLTGGTSLSGAAGVSESIVLTNKTDTQLNLNFFQYVDFDVFQADVDDTLSIVSGNTAQQDDNVTGSVEETVVSPAPGSFQADTGSTLLDSLRDGATTTLTDNPGPVVGDVNWAFGWDFTLGAAGSADDEVVISKIKDIALDSETPLPEPTSLALLALGGLALLRRGR